MSVSQRLTLPSMSARLRQAYPGCLSAVFILSASIVAGLLTGCGRSSFTMTAPVQRSVTLTGTVHGGSQPISGSTIQLYAANATQTAGAATPLISKTVKTESDGSFSISGDFTCLADQPDVYIVATGGNPGPSGNVNNLQIALMTALGACDQLSSTTNIAINEVTTVGSVAYLYPYMTDYAQVGYSDATTLNTAFLATAYFVDPAAGTAPGPSLPSGGTASTDILNSLANSIAACVNSSGGTAGTDTACGWLLTDATPPSGTAPADTVAAEVDILTNPTHNATPIFNLSTGEAPFVPTLSSAPVSWALSLTGTPPEPSLSPNSGASSTSGALGVTMSDTDTNVIYYYRFYLQGTNPGTYMEADGDKAQITTDGRTYTLTFDAYAFDPVLGTNSPVAENTYNVSGGVGGGCKGSVCIVDVSKNIH